MPAIDGCECDNGVPRDGSRALVVHFVRHGLLADRKERVQYGSAAEGVAFIFNEINRTLLSLNGNKPFWTQNDTVTVCDGVLCVEFVYFSNSLFTFFQHFPDPRTAYKNAPNGASLTPVNVQGYYYVEAYGHWETVHYFTTVRFPGEFPGADTTTYNGSELIWVYDGVRVYAYDYGMTSGGFYRPQIH